MQHQNEWVTISMLVSPMYIFRLHSRWQQVSLDLAPSLHQLECEITPNTYFIRAIRPQKHYELLDPSVSPNMPRLIPARSLSSWC